MDGKYQHTKRNLWLLTGIASIPFALMGIGTYSREVLKPILALAALVAVFDGWLVPFVLFKGVATLAKKVLVIGMNLFFATAWILFMGGAQSVFFPHLYFLPLLAVTIYGGFADGVVTALLTDAIALVIYYKQGLGDPVNFTNLAQQLIIFLLLTTVISYLLKAEEHFRSNKERLAEELQAAYDELSCSHQQLKRHTQVIEDLNRQLEKMAITDDLTALYNYRYFHTCLDQALNRQRQGYLSLLLADIDHFKEVNDTHGHGTGNEVLVQLAGVLQDNVRENDIVARYGGEEFAVILPDTGVEGAVHAAERIRRAVETFNFTGDDGNRVLLTLSIGISTFPHDAAGKNELITHADRALYRAKHMGRNGVYLYDGTCLPSPDEQASQETFEF